MTGKVFKYGDNVDTDVIIPARYLNTTSAKELAAHCMEDIDRNFAGNVRPGDIIVAGQNFGCGSSREHAPLAIKTCGVSYVIAASFARIFFRNAVNIGLPIVECPEAAADAQSCDEITVDLSEGKIVNRTKNKTYSFAPFSGGILDIINAGGLMKSVKKS